MIVVSDASPLIFLAKLDRLGLLAAVFDCKITILKCVADEVLSDRAGVLEKGRLQSFFNSSAEIIEFYETAIDSKTLSRCDKLTLSYCEQSDVDWLIADERLLRRIASAKGIGTMGFIGVLIGAMRSGSLTKEEVKNDLKVAIAEHGLRISIRLYQRILEELD